MQRSRRDIPRFVRLTPMLVFLLVSLLACTTKGDDQVSEVDDTAPEYVWVELGPDNGTVARAIISSGSCPGIELDDATFQMAARAMPPTGFADAQVCEYRIPPETASAAVNGRSLALPKEEPQRIVVVGDTGCRVEDEDIQNCTGEGEGAPWDFAELAAAISAANPDLIIHVGDYHYRERGSCDARCIQSNLGDNWPSWQADFFDPAQVILGQAPWIFVRGNHEDCERAWLGWFYLLDPHPLADNPWDQDNCQKYTDPYIVPAGGQNVLVMDNSEIADDEAATPDPTTVARYADEFSIVEELARDQTPAWLVSHRPLWGIASFIDSSGNPAIAFTDHTLRQALEDSTIGDLPHPPIEMLLAGHVHLFEMLNFPDGRPPQFVMGGGATELDPEITASLLDSDNGQAILAELGIRREDLTVVNGYSFGVIEPDDTGWVVTLKDLSGDDIGTFVIKKGN